MIETIAQALGNPLALLFFVIALAFLGIALALVVVLHRREKKADLRLKQARADITDMTILFQTMRDIIGQQKKLAKEFNVELEHKMGQVKHILNQGMEKNKQLYEKQLRISHDLEEAQAQIDSIFRQMARTGDGAGVPPARPVDPPRPRAAAPLREPRTREEVMVSAQPAPPRPKVSTPPLKSAIDALRAAPRTAPTPPADSNREQTKSAPSQSVHSNGGSTGKSILDAVRPAPRPAPPVAPPPEVAKKPDKLKDTGVTQSSFTSWVAEDFSTTDTPPRASTERPARSASTPAPPQKAAPTIAQDEEEPAAKNGDAAREAFRALLNIPSEEPPNRPPLDLPGQMASMANLSPSEESQDFAQDPANMQQRVLEYSEAGMTVAEVSRELGIGKGEVRLMLSLAKQGAPPNG